MKIKISKNELTNVLIAIKKNCIKSNWYNDEKEVDVTVGYTHSNGDWHIQTGDNSFSGPAYFHPVWGVSTLHAGCNCKSIASDIISDIISQIWDMAEEY